MTEYVKMNITRDGAQYRVQRTDRSGRVSLTPWTYTSKESAARYIAAHGLVAKEG